ncbi:hypothetical protein THAOC_13548 [Thalassiosira oceanica]|uniref:Uncharacterized protein n=1 Tax=Thalassiosira oceanica TaxID=159749 RepID=K0SJP9_THAOC|nr:hypothetical protein THAOC_13548 [Thalassiosira oceanica]|eukprot:EJK65575.1 hypothetical protein THAOC_13548 [Thalassiosira oceanica]
MFSVRYTSPRVTPKAVSARRDASGATSRTVEVSPSREDRDSTAAGVDTTLNDDSALPRKNLFALLSGPEYNGKVRPPMTSAVRGRGGVSNEVYKPCDESESSWQSQAEDCSSDEPVSENTTEASDVQDDGDGAESDIEGEGYQEADGDNQSRPPEESACIKLPPRVTRTACTQGNPSFMPELTQKQPLIGHSQTHSLLDDASDEDEISFAIVDESPVTYYPCAPMRRLKDQHHRRARSANSMATCSNQLTSNTIQQALLQTRHRRWDCLSAYAGQHQQPSNLFDLSSRAYVIPTFYYCDNIHGNTDGEMAFATRLSVSTQSVKAAAIASGLFRTATVVRLPAGLLLPHFAVARSRNTNRLGPALIEEYKDDAEDVWELLRTIRSTFSLCCEINFGGDLAGVAEEYISWRNDVIETILKILPSLSSIDGITVDSSFSSDYPFVKVDQFRRKDVEDDRPDSDSISGPPEADRSPAIHDLMIPIPMPRSQSWGPGCSGSKPPRASASATTRKIQTTSKKKRNCMRRRLSATKEASLMDGEESDESDLQ